MRSPQPFTAARAQQWVMAAALVAGMVYALRRFVEPTVSAAPAKGGKVARLAGFGSPPPPLGHWLVAYGTGFMLLGLVAVAAPELAGGISALVIAGTLLGNGSAVTADLRELQGATGAQQLAAQGPLRVNPATVINPSTTVYPGPAGRLAQAAQQAQGAAFGPGPGVPGPGGLIP